MKIAIYFIMLLGINTVQCQNITSDSTTTNRLKPRQDTIRRSGNLFTKEVYYYGQGNSLQFDDITDILSRNNHTDKFVNNAKVARVFALVFGFAGGFCIGYSLGPVIAGKEINLPLLQAGGGLLLVTIPLGLSYNTSMKKAVKIFNTEL